jgi:hypothetical protein
MRAARAGCGVWGVGRGVAYPIKANEEETDPTPYAPHPTPATEGSLR